MAGQAIATPRIRQPTADDLSRTGRASGTGSGIGIRYPPGRLATGSQNGTPTAQFVGGGGHKRQRKECRRRSFSPGWLRQRISPAERPLLAGAGPSSE